MYILVWIIKQILFKAGIIEAHFQNSTIILDQCYNYICHKGVRETWVTGQTLRCWKIQAFQHTQKVGV